MNPAPPETSPVTSFLTITPEAEKAKNLMKSITLIAEASRTEMQRLILSGATEKIDSEELDSDVRFNLSRTLQEYQELSHLINHHPTANREEIREAI
jgi:DNA-binding transcriptional regulator/RsmH inhibitor MraZ